MDIFISIAGILIVAPILLTVAILVSLDGGPVLFRQKRIGFRGAAFPCLKFRTMVPDAEAALARHLRECPMAAREWEKDQKLRIDPRVTKIGRFLRKYSLDELPQLFNVLKGEMSIVGPRPIVYQEAQRYGADFNYYISVRPGITGLWQVSGRNDTSYSYRVMLDKEYAQNHTIWGDVIIILKTFAVVFFAKGAY